MHPNQFPRILLVIALANIAQDVRLSVCPSFCLSEVYLLRNYQGNRTKLGMPLKSMRLGEDLDEKIENKRTSILDNCFSFVYTAIADCKSIFFI